MILIHYVNSDDVKASVNEFKPWLSEFMKSVANKCHPNPDQTG